MYIRGELVASEVLLEIKTRIILPIHGGEVWAVRRAPEVFPRRPHALRDLSLHAQRISDAEAISVKAANNEALSAGSRGSEFYRAVERHHLHFRG